MRPYRASNRVSLDSALLLLIVGIAAGAVAGGILWAVEYFTNFYLVIAFPILAGFVAGGALAAVVGVGKVRSPLLAALCGIVAGLTIYGVYHYATYYVTFRNSVRQAFLDEGQPAPAADELDQIIKDYLGSEFGDPGFVGFMRLAADEGFSITQTSGSSSTAIQGTAAWIYWAVEIVVAVGIAAFTASRRAGQPFDENAGAWYGPVTDLASTSRKARKALINALKNGDFEAAGRLLTTQPVKGAVMLVGTRRSPDASAQDIILVVQQKQGNNSTVVQQGVITAMDLQRLTRAIDSAPLPS